MGEVKDGELTESLASDRPAAGAGQHGVHINRAIAATLAVLSTV